MPRNSSGTMSATNGPYTSGTVISSTAINARLGDIETEITSSLDRTGRGGMTAPLRTANGTVAAPSFSYTSDTGTGTYLAAAGDPRISISGVDFLTKTGIAFPGTGATLAVTGTDGQLVLQGNRNAASVTPEVAFITTTTRTAGLIAQFFNNTAKLGIDYLGLLRLDAGAAAAAIQPASMVTAVTPTAPWGTARAMGYWKDATGTVKIKGSAIWHTAAGVLTVLAAGFRPADQRAFVAFNRMRGGFVVLSVSSGGAVSLDAGTVVDGDEIYFDPISFLAEQ